MAYCHLFSCQHSVTRKLEYITRTVSTLVEHDAAKRNPFSLSYGSIEPWLSLRRKLIECSKCAVNDVICRHCEGHSRRRLAMVVWYSFEASRRQSGGAEIVERDADHRHDGISRCLDYSICLFPPDGLEDLTKM
jgi:ribosomal protein L37AE/L43A